MKTALLLLALWCGLAAPSYAAGKLNLLVITVDDMSADSLGAFGCKLPTSPNIDRLAALGMRFNRAHVVVGNCMPSRNVMWSGRYPHNTGVEGFYQVPEAKHPHLADVMKGAGYFTGIRHKVSHSTPYSPYGWDLDLDRNSAGKRADVKNAKSYAESLQQGIAGAKQAGKPFCLILNVADPHKPFYAEGKGGVTVPDANVPSLVFKPEEVPIPGFLFDDPVVRKELAHYYSSVRRADDAVGEILSTLAAAGHADDTAIMFLSDHGMPLPFVKTQLYHHSTRTPLCFIVPGTTKSNTADDDHMVSAVDLMPTLLEALGVPAPAGMDGRSFAPLLSGGKQDGRNYVIKEYNENAGGSRDPMRAIQTPTHLYVFNAWSNGDRVMATATTGTSTYRRMAQLAKTDAALGARHDVYQHRTVEELYDVANDPDCLKNLNADPKQRSKLNELRGTLESWMVETRDPMLEVFRKRDNAAFREAYVVAQEKEADERGAGGKRKGVADDDADAATPAAVNKRNGLISLMVPDSVAAGKPVTVKIEHHFPANLGEQSLTITLKDAAGKRLNRKIVKAKADGVAEATFDVPAGATAVSVAAFVGEVFQKTPQHLQSKLIPAK